MTTARCPHCHQPVTRTVDDEVAGLPVDLHPAPVPPAWARLAAAAGLTVVATHRHRRTTSRHRVDHQWRGVRDHDTHHVEHICGHTPPAAPPPPPRTATRPDEEAPF